MHLTDGRRGRIVLDEHRHRQHVADQIFDADRSPGRVIGGLVRQVGTRDVVRERDADPHQAILGDAGLVEKLADRSPKKGSDRLWLREMNLSRGPRPHLADEIENHQSHMVAIDVEPDREPAVWIDHEFRGGLAARAAQSAGVQYQLIVQQPIDDIRDRRRCETGVHRKPGPGHRPVDSNGVQRYALVVVAGAREVGAREVRCRT